RTEHAADRDRPRTDPPAEPGAGPRHHSSRLRTRTPPPCRSGAVPLARARDETSEERMTNTPANASSSLTGQPSTVALAIRQATGGDRGGWSADLRRHAHARSLDTVRRTFPGPHRPARLVRTGGGWRTAAATENRKEEANVSHHNPVDGHRSANPPHAYGEIAA